MLCFKKKNEKNTNYTEFENMADDNGISDNRMLPFNITSRKICKRRDGSLKCPLKCPLKCNLEWICEKLDKIIDSVLIITIHIFFISIFEPLFYLNYVVKLEYNFIIDKIVDETSLLYQQYITYPSSTRYFIDTMILGDKYKTLKKLKIEKDKIVAFKLLQKDALYIQGIIYSCSILGFILVMCIYKYIRKSKIKFCKIFLENLVMILFLFIYEYIFFNNFIMKYDTIDTAEINYYSLLNFINYTTFHPAK